MTHHMEVLHEKKEHIDSSPYGSLFADSSAAGMGRTAVRGGQ